MVRLVEDPIDGFLRIRVDGAWVTPRAIYLRHNNEWHPLKSLNIMVENEWRAVFVNSHRLQVV
jgi:hypothetical protein